MLLQLGYNSFHQDELTKKWRNKMTKEQIIAELTEIKQYATDCADSFEKQIVKESFWRLSYLLSALSGKVEDNERP